MNAKKKKWRALIQPEWRKFYKNYYELDKNSREADRLRIVRLTAIIKKIKPMVLAQL